jgi:hypothetical protein
MNLEQVNKTYGALVAERLVKDVPGLEWSKIEVEIIKSTLEDEQAARIAGRMNEKIHGLEDHRHKEVYTKSYSSKHHPFPDSPLGRFERMFNSPICILCIHLGGINVKPRNKAFCGYHMSRPPKGFRCSNKETRCYYKQLVEGKCPKCNVYLTPYWDKMPEHLEFLKGSKKLPKWIYAQIVQGRGLERGLSTMDRVGEILCIGNGSKILEAIDAVEIIEKELKI